MFRALCLTALMIVAAPASASDIASPADAADAAIVAQDNQRPQQQAPKRDCERNQEGVSA